ncbi:Uncharacterised protein [Mycobacteroides abscessus subsp. abscessus]|nr:Uncharacterised protein [Mycobacteroides abscessus subsp. abscessus]
MKIVYIINNLKTFTKPCFFYFNIISHLLKRRLNFNQFFANFQIIAHIPR